MLLSCPAKKVTKECGQRGAEAGCSRTRAVPFGIPRRALTTALEHLNLNPVRTKNVPIFYAKGKTSTVYYIIM